MPSITELCLFVAAFVGAFAFGDDALRLLGVAPPNWRRRK
jgi:hypothetical protein